MTEMEALTILNNPKENYNKPIWIDAIITIRRLIEWKKNNEVEGKKPINLTRSEPFDTTPVPTDINTGGKIAGTSDENVINHISYRKRTADGEINYDGDTMLIFDFKTDAEYVLKVLKDNIAMYDRVYIKTLKRLINRNSEILPSDSEIGWTDLTMARVEGLLCMNTADISKFILKLPEPEQLTISS